MAQGLSNRAIAGRLGISEQAVKQHVSRLLVALGARNRVGLVRHALTRRSHAATDEAFRDLLAHAPVLAAMTKGPAHTVEYANPPLVEYLGGRRVVGKPVRLLNPELERQGIFGLMDRVLSAREPYSARRVPLRFAARGDGVMRERVLDIAIQPRLDARGAGMGLVVLGVDVTDEARREQALRYSPAGGLDRLATGVIVLDATGHVVLLNEPAQRIFGKAPSRDVPLAQQARAYDLRDATDGRRLGPAETPAGRALAGGAVADAELILRRPSDGRDARMRSTATPIRGPSGEVAGAIISCTEVAP